MDLPYMKFQVINIPADHSVESYLITFKIQPIVIELGLVHRLDHLNNMQVGAPPELD